MNETGHRNGPIHGWQPPAYDLAGNHPSCLASRCRNASTVTLLLGSRSKRCAWGPGPTARYSQTVLWGELMRVPADKDGEKVVVPVMVSFVFGISMVQMFMDFITGHV